MQLGLAGRRALVCAASKGLGRACALALAREGVDVVITARHQDTLLESATILRQEAPSVKVTTVVGDIATEEGREAALSVLPDPDILINNAGGPPPGDFRNFTRDDWIKALDANMLAPIALIKATIDRMAERKFGRIVNITSGAVKAPIGVLGLSNGARAGLTGFVAGVARQVASSGVTINNLLPGKFDTDRLRQTLKAQAERNGRSLVDEISVAERAVPAGRFGHPDEFGAFCAFLCSTQAAYMTGQNILLDGGAYPGVL